MKPKELREIASEIVTKYQSGMSTYDIARELNSHPWNINKILATNNVMRRSQKEVNHKRFAKDIKISGELQEMIDGWLLGDGNLSFTGVQAYFGFVSKYEEYVDYVMNQFKKNDIICKKYHGVDKKYKTDHFRLKTPSTIQFGKLYHRWYENGKKIVPSDLQLNINTIKNWIMDDGTLDKKMGHLRLCTCAFTIEECEDLSSKLNQFIQEQDGSWVIEKEKNPRIYIPKIMVKKLYEKLGKCEISCFAYKFNQQLTSIGDLS